MTSSTHTALMKTAQHAGTDGGHFARLSKNRVIDLMRSPLFAGVVFLATVVQVIADPLVSSVNSVGVWDHPLPQNLVIYLAAFGCLVQALLVTQLAPYPILSLIGGLSTYLVVALALDVPSWAAPMQLVVAVALFGVGSATRAGSAFFWAAASIVVFVVAMTLWARATGAPPEAVATFVLTGAAGFVTVALAGVSLGLLWAAHERRTLRADERARELARQQAETVEATRTAERGRIAQELHDIAGQHLAGLVSLCDASAELAPTRPQQALELIDEVRAEGRFAAASLYGALGDLRRVGDTKAVHTPDARDLGNLITFWRERGMTLEDEIRGDVTDLPAVVSTTAYRAAQEGLSNVAKHAPGADVRVSLTLDGHRLTLLVENTAPLRAGTLDSNFGLGWGLEGLRKKLALVDGMLQAASDDAGGWRLEVRIPLPELSGDERV